MSVEKLRSEWEPFFPIVRWCAVLYTLTTYNTDRGKGEMDGTTFFVLCQLGAPIKVAPGVRALCTASPSYACQFAFSDTKPLPSNIEMSDLI